MKVPLEQGRQLISRSAVDFSVNIVQIATERTGATDRTGVHSAGFSCVALCLTAVLSSFELVSCGLQSAVPVETTSGQGVHGGLKDREQGQDTPFGSFLCEWYLSSFGLSRCGARSLAKGGGWQVGGGRLTLAR